MRRIGENGATQPPNLFFRSSNHAPVLCLQLLSTPRFSTLHDQTPGSTSLPSFVSDAAVLPGPFQRTAALISAPLWRVSPSNGGMSNCQMSAAPRNVRWTLLLSLPRDCGQVPACPQKRLRDSVASVFQGPWKIATHIWHQASPSTTLPQPSKCGCLWDLLGPGSFNSLYQCPSSSGTTFPMWTTNFLDPTLFLGIHISHQTVTRYRAAELWPLPSPCLQS